MIRLYRTITAVCLGILLSVFLYFHFTAESAPRLANYYLRWDIRAADVPELAKWDLIVLDMETQINSKEKIQQIRKLNPDIIILAYVTVQEIRDDAGNGGSMLRRELAAGIQDEWYMTDTNSNKYSFWSGTHMLNPTDKCPYVNGQQWSTYLADFMAKKVLATGLWDGVLYDNTWGGLTWFSGKQVDLNRDGVADGETADNSWRAGMRNLFNETRKAAGSNKYILVGNAVGPDYGEELNGIMIENFNNHEWRYVMNMYREQSRHNTSPRVLIINANTKNTGDNKDYRSVRFSLASTLLEDGYFAYDYGDKDHSQVWWYDEYNINLGEPVGPAQGANRGSVYNPDVWRRDYDHGVVLVNATKETHEVNLGTEYEKIIGQQDPLVNDGSLTDKVKLAPQDGLIMLKSTQLLQNVPFENGAFARFLDMHGQRMRNGFFVFDEANQGSDLVWHGDLNSESGEEKIVASTSKLNIYNSKGDYWYDDYPFGVEYKKGMGYAVGKIGESGEASLVVTNARGAVSLYNYYGGPEKLEFYPWGKKFNGQFSAALGNVDPDGNVILGGGGPKNTGKVLIYDNKMQKLIKTIVPYGASYRGGVQVAAGDVNGDGKDEIITTQKNVHPLVRVWDGSGQKLSEFYFTSSFGSTKIRLGAADVNYDGRDEIVLMGK